MKGPPGSGKSTLARELGWEAFTLSKDNIRLLRRGAELNSQGYMHISQEENDQVEREFVSLIDKRMDRGEFLVLDAMFVDYPSHIMPLVEKHRYQCAVLDLSQKDIEVIKEQNTNRAEYKQVPSHIVEKIHTKLTNKKPWEGITHFTYDEKGQYLKDVQQWAKEDILDLSHFDEVVHIGDLQGCLTVLLDKDGPLDDGKFAPNKTYIFVGDLLDRGIENGKLLRWFLNHAVPLDNVFLLWGNHETHIHRFAKGLPAVSEEFEKKTLPQLLEEGITPNEADLVCQKAVEFMLYTYNEHRVMVTHAGLPTIPIHPELISLHQYSKGTGRWSDPIDEQFERNAPSTWVQVHGHRNHGFQDIQARPRSFNLEDQVEFGGRLRFATLSQQGWKTGSVRNKVYHLEGASKIERKKINWTHKGVTLSDQAKQNLVNHIGVKQRVQDTAPHIASFNFTKDVFFKSAWDDVVVKARGFFVNTTTNEIVSRGYDKFFNINEKPDVSMDNLCKSFTFPVIGYVKENGYLGNIGYDDESGELFIASKSSCGGDFADWFKEIVDQNLTKTQQEGLARFLRDNEACMTFEVIDPVRDPHMVEYDKPQMILLDVFHRNEEAERLPYEELKGVARKFNLSVKQRGLVLHDEQAFRKWHEKVEGDLTWRHHGRDIEGFVFEDMKGNMTKIKMPYYDFWKKMRGQKERIKKEWQKILEQGELRNQKLDKEPLSQAPRFNVQKARQEFVEKWTMSVEHPVAQRFLAFCAGLEDTSKLDQSIIALRQMFLDEVEVPQHEWEMKFLPYKDRDLSASSQSSLPKAKI